MNGWMDEWMEWNEMRWDEIHPLVVTEWHLQCGVGLEGVSHVVLQPKTRRFVFSLQQCFPSHFLSCFLSFSLFLLSSSVCTVVSVSLFSVCLCVCVCVVSDELLSFSCANVFHLWVQKQLFMCVEPTHKRAFSSNPGVASPDCNPQLVQWVRELESHRGSFMLWISLLSVCLFRQQLFLVFLVEYFSFFGFCDLVFWLSQIYSPQGSHNSLIHRWLHFGISAGACLFVYLFFLFVGLFGSHSETVYWVCVFPPLGDPRLAAACVQKQQLDLG